MGRALASVTGPEGLPDGPPSLTTCRAVCKGKGGLGCRADIRQPQKRERFQREHHKPVGRPAQ